MTSSALPIVKGSLRLENGIWFRLPMKLRQRWWTETNYGELEPSPELMKAINEALKSETDD